MMTVGEHRATAGRGLPPRPASGARDASIRFGVDRCDLGTILVATTAKGILAILLGDDPDALVGDLRRRFPEADVTQVDVTRANRARTDDAFVTTMAEVIGFVEVPAGGLDLPLDIGGTAFQQSVWQALRAIPAGSTATYAEVARAIGRPAAARAVAAACAANPLAVAIPCHRVVRADGGLSGYRWGVARKRRLLALERGEPSCSGPSCGRPS